MSDQFVKHSASRKYSQFLLDDVVEFLRQRANDPWPDNLWPAANRVLMAIADELTRSENRAELIESGWRAFQENKQ